MGLTTLAVVSNEVVIYRMSVFLEGDIWRIRRMRPEGFVEQEDLREFVVFGEILASIGNLMILRLGRECKQYRRCVSGKVWVFLG